MDKTTSSVEEKINIKLQPLITIVVPTYNSALTVGNCLNSILEQTFLDYEVLLIDGLSTDNTIVIAKQYQDKRIKIFSERDKGIYDAMNKGIDKALGNWLVFLGSDDTLYNREVLQIVAKTIETNPTSKFIYGDVFTSNNYLQRYENYNYEMLLDTSICHQCIYYHRTLFNNQRYDIAFKICADWDFNLKVFNKQNNPVYIPKPLANFNLSGVSNNWMQHPEFLQYFSNKASTILRYRSRFYLLTFQIKKQLNRVKLKALSILKKASNKTAVELL